MLKRRFVSYFAALMLMGTAACGGEDVPVGGADPGGMGAGRPDTIGADNPTEQNATEVLDGMNVNPMGTQQDTSDPGGVPGQQQPRQQQR